MTEAMRWFGPADTVTLAEIRQTGAAGVYSALHEFPAGEVWPAAGIAKRKAEIEAAGLAWVAVESVPVSEAINRLTQGLRLLTLPDGRLAGFQGGGPSSAARVAAARV